MPQQSKSSKPQPTEPRNLLEQMDDRLRAKWIASGLTETDPEPASDTGTLKVSFVPRRATKPTEPPAE